MQLPNDLYSFLSDLQQNNNRDWFTNHKLRFKSIETQLKAFGEQLKDYLNHHDHIDRFKLFRIYRDVRFSKDKTPYQTHVSAAIAKDGKKTTLPGFYFQLSADRHPLHIR